MTPLKPTFHVKKPEDLPNQLVIKDGKLIVKATGEAPQFPACIEGFEVNVVTHADLKRLMKDSKMLRFFNMTQQRGLFN